MIFAMFIARVFSFLLAFTVVTASFAQVPTSFMVDLEWDEAPLTVSLGEADQQIFHFDGGIYLMDTQVPYFSKRIALPSHGTIEASIVAQKSSSLNTTGMQVDIKNSQPIIRVEYETERHQFFARVIVRPVFVSGGAYAKLDQFRVQLNFTQTPQATTSRGTPTKISKLSDGDIYKFSISQNGVHKISASFLKELGIDVANINPKNIQLLGNGGRRLPEIIATDRIDDLAENAIFISGESDGSFDDEDFILFYATGPKPVVKASDNLYRIDNSPYTEKAYYFIKLGNTQGKRIQNQTSLASASYTTNSFLDCQRYELDKVNLLDLNTSSEGGGNEWYGELFKVDKVKSFSDKFSFKNVIKDKEATIKIRFASYSKVQTSMSATVEGKMMQTSFDGKPGTWDDVSSIRNLSTTFFPKGDNLAITLNYNTTNVGDATGYLDYIEINAYRKLQYDGTPLTFGSLSKEMAEATTFEITNNDGDLIIWDVSVPTSPQKQAWSQSGSLAKFSINTNTVKRFTAFRLDNDFFAPTAMGKIENQNVHGIEKADFIIVYHESLRAEAEKLALHRQTQSGMNVVVVDVDDIFNEFSSGALDPTAIRDFVKMVYDRDPDLRYLLLMGDGSYDHKNIAQRDPNYNLVPVRETESGIKKVNTFPSDDYYGLLSDDEGNQLTGSLDIAVGRITAETPEVANAIVEKIIHYDTSPEVLKPWRTQLVCIGDDADGGTHMRQANETADVTEKDHPSFVAKKVLLDAFAQVPAPYGERFPEASKQINDAILKGTLVMNYFGHGGANGLAQERVITLQSISKWKNIKNHLPLVITASCSTAGFDDPSIKTFGEELLKNPTGGAIALFSTVRPVYAHTNESLIDATYPEIFITDNGKKRPVGEILRVGKNKTNTGVNGRKFLLLGDPSMPIAIPDNNSVVTDKINGIDPKVVDSIGIQSLTKVTIEGHIGNPQGQLMNDFNGKVYVSIFDKEIERKTLGQDSYPMAYTTPKGIIFKGNATVKNGKFEFAFVVPKDVASQGFGRINYYASDLVSKDAAGYEKKLFIGGSGGAIIVDNTPPVVELFMNDEKFVDGGKTNDHPIIFAKLSDDNGINISGSGIGHDLTATIDGDIKVANDYYEANADDYTQGEMHYPLEGLALGEHTIEVKAWDVANNSGSSKITFIVAESGGGALEHVLNYPNPFTDNTTFQFEHSLLGAAKVRIDIYSVDGKIIKTIDQDIQSEGFRVSDISWDGKDEYGDPLARGVYIYKVKLISLENEENTTTSGFEKLVIMK